MNRKNLLEGLAGTTGQNVCFVNLIIKFPGCPLASVAKNLLICIPNF